MFTALMTRELKTKFDREYKTYKDSLCDVAEIDHENVKQLLLSQAKNFFGSMRSKGASLRHDVNQKIQSSKALISLEELIEANGEYFGEKAGEPLEREKEAFDRKLEKGRFASVVKNQTFYKEVINTLDKANSHMVKTLEEANDLLSRVIQVNPAVDSIA